MDAVYYTYSRHTGKVYSMQYYAVHVHVYNLQLCNPYMSHTCTMQVVVVRIRITL
jgi:hypothetical protein